MYTKIAAAAALASTVSAQAYQGFNYGVTFTSGAAKQTSDFQNEFTTAQNLVGHTGFSSARLYTMIQSGTTNTPVSAIQAAINTKTSLLLGLWASAGQTAIDNEIAALKSAISQYGTAFTDLIAGISVGSEDLYRITPTGIQNKAGVGAAPADITSYIQQVRQAVSGSGASKVPIGHVDTWTAWVNGSNSAVIDNCDFLGVDSYPYFQTVDANGIENGANLFFEAYGNTTAAANGKPVWITETGWPVSGAPSAQAIASTENAKQYWDDVACKVLGQTNTWWYTLQDAEPDTPSPSFGLVSGPQLSTTPLFDLSCSNTSKPTNTSTGTGSSPSGSGSGSGSSGNTSSSGSSSTGEAGASSGSGSTGSGATSGNSNGSSSGSSSGSSTGSSSTGGDSSSSANTGSNAGSSNGGISSSAPGSYGSSSSGTTGSSSSNSGSSAPDSYGSSSGGSSGSSSSESGSSAPGSYDSSSSGSSSGSSSSSSSSSGSSAGSSSPYYAPYGSSNSTGAGAASPTGGLSGSKTGAPGAAYTGAATANKASAMMVAGVMGLAALLA